MSETPQAVSAPPRAPIAVWSVRLRGFHGCCFDTLTAALEEVRFLMETTTDEAPSQATITIHLYGMTQAEYDALPESDGP